MDVSDSSITEEEIAAICRCVLEALSYLHAIPMVHGHIRLETIFLDARGTIKLSTVFIQSIFSE